MLREATAPALLYPEEIKGSRVNTARSISSYLGPNGILLGKPRSRGWVRSAVRDYLQVARTEDQIFRCNYVWRYLHYIKPRKPGKNPFPPNTVRMHYILHLPALRSVDPPYPAAAVMVRFALKSSIPADLPYDHPYEVLEIGRNWVADDLRYPTITDLTPAILREITRRVFWDWSNHIEAVNAKYGPVRGTNIRARPRWLLAITDPSVGHDGGLYRGAGFDRLAELPCGKLVFGQPVRPLRAVA